MANKFTLLLFIVILSFSFSSIKAQELSAYIKENAVTVTNPGNLNDSIYKLLAPFKLIMLGEMHGMNEPAKFIIGLAKLLNLHKDSVQVGLEIPAEQMSAFLNQSSDSSIYKSDFFTKEPLYGLESFAWAEIILSLNKMNNVKLFFYDQNKEDTKISANRDSLMYLKIKDQIKKNPGWKTITLSGNIHNMIQPFNGQTKMALYLKKDSELNLGNKLCSLKHQYKDGQMINNMGDGLKLRPANAASSDYSTAVNYDGYLLLLPQNFIDRYNGIYFTRNVTAAQMVNPNNK
jgi:hypothetical protein